MANTSSKPEKKKVFDVAKPGKVAAHASSRPLIVGHGPIVQDPMVAPQATSSEPAKETKKNSPAPTKVAVSGGDDAAVAPLSPHPKEVTPPDHEETDTPPDKSDEPAKQPEPDPSPTAQPEELNEEKPTDSKEEAVPFSVTNASVLGTDSNDGDVGAAASEADAKEANQESEAEKAKREALQKLVDDKKYFVHVGEVKSTRLLRRILVTILVLLLLGIVGADLAIDAGLVKTNIKPPLDLIKN